MGGFTHEPHPWGDKLIVPPGSPLEGAIAGLGRLVVGLGGFFTQEGDLRLRLEFTPGGHPAGVSLTDLQKHRVVARVLNPEDTVSDGTITSPLLVKFDHDADFNAIVGAQE